MADDTNRVFLASNLAKTIGVILKTHRTKNLRAETNSAFVSALNQYHCITPGNDLEAARQFYGLVGGAA